MISGILFLLMAPAFSSIALCGVASAAGVEALLKTPRSVITIDEKYHFHKILWKNQGLK